MPDVIKFSSADILIGGMLLTMLAGLTAWVLVSWKAGVSNAADIKQVATLLKAFTETYETRHKELTDRVKSLEQDSKELMRRGNG